jgi:hypothetical protein
MNTSALFTGLRGLTATAIFGALASSFSPISAADPPSSAGITVKYAELNPASPSGAPVLYERIHTAAQHSNRYSASTTSRWGSVSPSASSLAETRVLGSQLRCPALSVVVPDGKG